MLFFETISLWKVLFSPSILKQCETDLIDLAVDPGRKTDYHVSIIVTLFWPRAKMESHHGETEEPVIAIKEEFFLILQ